MSAIIFRPLFMRSNRNTRNQNPNQQPNSLSSNINTSDKKTYVWKPGLHQIKKNICKYEKSFCLNNVKWTSYFKIIISIMILILQIYKNIYDDDFFILHFWTFRYCSSSHDTIRLFQTRTGTVKFENLCLP